MAISMDTVTIDGHAITNGGWSRWDTSLVVVASGLEPNSTVRLLDGQITGLLDTQTSNSSGEATFTYSTPLANSLISLYIDHDGSDPTSSRFEFTVDTDAPDAPVLVRIDQDNIGTEMVEQTVGSSWYTTKTPITDLVIYGDAPGAASVTITLKDDGMNVIASESGLLSSDSFSISIACNLTGTTDKQYWIEVVAYDEAGNSTARDGGAATFYIDRVVPVDYAYEAYYPVTTPNYFDTSVDAVPTQDLITPTISLITPSGTGISSTVELDAGICTPWWGIGSPVGNSVAEYGGKIFFPHGNSDGDTFAIYSRSEHKVTRFGLYGDLSGYGVNKLCVAGGFAYFENNTSSLIAYDITGDSFTEYTGSYLGTNDSKSCTVGGKSIVGGTFYDGSLSRIGGLLVDGVPTSAQLRDVRSLCAYNGKAYFTAECNVFDETYPRKLFSYDPVSGAIVQIANLNTAAGDDLWGLTAFNGFLYFIYSYNLYKYDGTSIVKITDSTDVEGLVAHDISLFLQAANDIYEHNGTTIVKIFAGTTHPKNLHTHNGMLFFSYNIGGGKYKLFKYDGSAIKQISDITNGGNDDIREITSVGDDIYFMTGNGNLMRLNAPVASAVPENIVMVGGVVVGEIAVDPTVTEILYDDDNDPETPSVALPAGSIVRNTTDTQKFIKRSTGGSKSYVAIPVTPKTEWQLPAGANAAWAILQNK